MQALVADPSHPRAQPGLRAGLGADGAPVSAPINSWFVRESGGSFESDRLKRA